MGDLLAYLTLGFRHIADVRAVDHILFLLVLAAIYRPADWKAALTVVTAFTVGHSLTLGFAATGLLVLPSAWVEFLIPVTIVATGAENLWRRERIVAGEMARHRPVFALLFGLVHGAGFAGYLRSLLVEEIAWPLIGFNLGVELGQLVVLALAALGFVLLDRAIEVLGRGAGAFRLRLTAVSASVSAVATVWAWQRLP